MRSDIVIVAANAVSLTLLGCIIWFKLRERKAPDDAKRSGRA